MKLHLALEGLEKSKVTSKFSGFFNVESGFASVATKVFDYCECPSSTFGEGSCQECGRREGVFISFPSGDGDGIYVTYKFLNPNQEVVGAITFFDYQYHMANFVKSSLNNGLNPKFPTQLAHHFSQTRSLKLSQFRKPERLIFAEATYHQGSEYEPVSIEVTSDRNFLCYAFCEEVDNSEEGVIKQLQQQGIEKSQAISAARGAAAAFGAVAHLSGISEDQNPFPDFCCRAIFVIAEGLLGSEVMEDFVVVDWNLAEIRARYGSVQTSHRVPMHESTREQNQIWAKLERERKI